MNLKNISDGVYDRKLNKTTFDLGDVWNDGMHYIVHKGRRYEIKFTNWNIGSISLKDVTDAGMARGKITELTIEGEWGDSVVLMNAINVFGGGTASMVGLIKLLEKGAKGASGNYNRGTVNLDGHEFSTNISIEGSGSAFSIMGFYKKIVNRPKKWSRVLVIRGLMNFQLQQTSSYKFDDYSGQETTRKPLDVKFNMDLAKEISDFGRTGVNWSGRNDDSNFVGVRFHSNKFYTLEIIDPKIRVSDDQIMDMNGRVIKDGDTLRFTDKFEWYRAGYTSQLIGTDEQARIARQKIEALPYHEVEINLPTDLEWLRTVGEIQEYWAVVN